MNRLEPVSENKLFQLVKSVKTNFRHGLTDAESSYFNLFLSVVLTSNITQQSHPSHLRDGERLHMKKLLCVCENVGKE